MKTQKNTRIQRIALMVVTVAALVGCGKSNADNTANPALAPAEAPAAANAAASSSDLQTFPSKPGGDTKVRVEGTSTVHDWRLQGSIIGGAFKAGKDFPTEPGQEAKPGPVTAEATVFIPVRSLTSREKDGSHFMDRMDEVVYEDLAQETYPRIVYHLTKLTLKQAPASKDGAYVFDAEGTLAVHGVTNMITMPVNATPLGNKTIRFTGSTNLKLSDYKVVVKPPMMTALIKVGDEVKLIFDWTVQQKSAPAATK